MFDKLPNDIKKKIFEINREDALKNRKFQVGKFDTHYDENSESLQNYCIEIKKITKTKKLSFIVKCCYTDFDFYNLRYCRKIFTDDKGNEYIKSIDLNPGKCEYYSYQWLTLKASEMNKYKIKGDFKRV